MKIIKLTSILVLALISFQCVSSKKGSSTEKESTNTEANIDNTVAESASAEQDLIMTKKGFTKGVIVDKTGLDGCTFLIEIDNSKILHPINLDDKYKKDGLGIYIVYKKSRKATTCMNGQPIIISKIQIAK
tara:strand:- start:191 stop:583 length:393 start_codon:yes stop_codon:yes gene_type:complete